MRRQAWAAAVIPVLLAGCNAPDDAAPTPDKDVTAAEASTSTGYEATEPSAVANLETASGVAAGKAAAVPMKESVLLTLQVEGLPPGRHGVHVHMVGKCDPPGFESAGSHWNPSGARHGLEAPEGQHAGDMPNLVVKDDGKGTLAYELRGATFAGLLDADGSAMVVHASADDQKTDPSGNSGDRIACGIFRSG